MARSLLACVFVTVLAAAAGCTHVDGNFPDLDPDDYRWAEADWCVHSTPCRLVTIEPTSDYFDRIAKRRWARRRRLVERAGERVAAGRESWYGRLFPGLHRMTAEAKEFALYRGEILVGGADSLTVAKGDFELTVVVAGDTIRIPDDGMVLLNRHSEAAHWWNYDDDAEEAVAPLRIAPGRYRRVYFRSRFKGTVVAIDAARDSL